MSSIDNLHHAGAALEGVPLPVLPPQPEGRSTRRRQSLGDVVERVGRTFDAFPISGDREHLRLFGCVAEYEKGNKRAVEDFYRQFNGLSKERKAELLNKKTVGGKQTLWEAMESSGLAAAYQQKYGK